MIIVCCAESRLMPVSNSLNFHGHGQKVLDTVLLEGNGKE